MGSDGGQGRSVQLDVTGLVRPECAVRDTTVREEGGKETVTERKSRDV